MTIDSPLSRVEEKPVIPTKAGIYVLWIPDQVGDDKTFVIPRKTTAVQAERSEESK